MIAREGRVLVSRVRHEVCGNAVDMRQLATMLYRTAFTVSLPPLRFVADELGTSVSTATRWMARARSAGLAEDLITRETYNRMQADTRAEEMSRPVTGPANGGQSLGR